MNILQNYEIYLGTIAGSLVHYNQNKTKTVLLKSEEKCEITSLSWGRKSPEILIGYKKGHSKIYNLSTTKTKNISQLEQSQIVGIIPVNKEILLATNTGNVYHWKKGNSDHYLKCVDAEKTVEKFLKNPFDENVFGVGGRSNDIKLYDISTKKVVFQGKSDRHDELELAQPVCINSFTFLNNATGLDLATVTRQGQIRIYDTRAQRRALKIYKAKDIVFTTISASNSENEIVVGSNKGYLQIIDIRGQIKPIKTFKGYMGGITDVVCDSKEPIVASCSLDRHFRIHNIAEKKVEFEEYIKIQTPRMLMRRRNLNASEDEEIKQNLEETETNKRSIQEDNKKTKKLKT